MFKNSALRLSAIPLVVLPLLAGCAATGPMVANHPADTCAVDRVGLQPGPSEADQATKVVGAALVGAATGAIIGGITGGGRGAAIGAASGGTVGAISGVLWVNADRQQRETMLAQRYGSIRTFASEVDRAQVAFDRLQACRRTQVAAVRADLRAKRVDRTIAEQRLDQIRAWQRDDVVLAQHMATTLGGQMRTQVASVDEIQRGLVDQERAAAFRPYSAVLTDAATVRRAPDGAAATADTLPAGQVVRVTSMENGWARIDKAGKPIGYVRPTLLARESSPKSLVASASESIRSVPRPDGSPVGSVGAGQREQVTATLPGWVAITQKSAQQRGFVPASVMQAGATMESQQESLARATATNAQLTDAFASSVQNAKLDTSLGADI